MDMLHSRSHNHVILSSIMTYHRICNTNNTTDAISLFRTGYPSITYEFTLVFVCVVFFWRIRVFQSLLVYVVFCGPLVILSTVLVLPMHSLSLDLVAFKNIALYLII